ncbi:MAG: hypothetical protein PHP69_04840 [Candidatus Omnitrophica bacterium]|nr:hypothetical protein [Candidatus Omnitrophota bacterium]MDD5080393.1 hypothetical protein [Candidatus Omnitrophota bacterium]MDD5440721.1 hypothetical protein [Candidatus Omnitrophota bacterium]
MCETIDNIKKMIEEQYKSANWHWRALLLLFYVYLGMKYLFNPAYWGLFGNIDLGIHEMGHLLFMFCGEFIACAGGTILQLAAPIVSFFMFAGQRDYFAFSFSGVWFAANLYNVSWYMADARAQTLPLASLGGGSVSHDWAYLLGRLGLLNYDIFFAGILRFIAFLCMWSSIFYGIWVVRIIVKSSQDGDDSIC